MVLNSPNTSPGDVCTDLPLHKTTNILDLLPRETYDQPLPPRTRSLSWHYRLLHNRFFQTLVGIILALVFIAGAAALGVYLGKHAHPVTPEIPTVTVTPPVKTIGRMEVVTAGTTTVMVTRTTDRLVILPTRTPEPKPTNDNTGGEHD